jgi:hypothetical protein
MQFAARLAPIDRVRAGQIAPLFARTLTESTTARDQSTLRMPKTSSVQLTLHDRIRGGARRDDQSDGRADV